MLPQSCCDCALGVATGCQQFGGGSQPSAARVQSIRVNLFLRKNIHIAASKAKICGPALHSLIRSGALVKGKFVQSGSEPASSGTQLCISKADMGIGMDNHCVNRVMNGAAMGGALGASIGAERVRLPACTPVRNLCCRSSCSHLALLVRCSASTHGVGLTVPCTPAAGSLYGTYDAFRLRVGPGSSA